MEKDEIIALIGAIILFIMCLFGLISFGRLLSRVYKAIKEDRTVDTRKTIYKFLVCNGFIFVSLWLILLLQNIEINLSIILLSFFKAFRAVFILLVLSGICIYQVIQYNKKKRREMQESPGNDSNM